MSIQGSCLCGTLKYEIDGPFSMMMSCHCSMCRKHHGAPFATFAAAPLDGFRWLSGESAVKSFASSSHGQRSFCSVCEDVALAGPGDIDADEGNGAGDRACGPARR